MDLATLGFWITVIALVVTVVVQMIYDWIKEKASERLPDLVVVQALPNPQSDGTATYWLVEVKVGRGRCWMRMPGRELKLTVFATAHFIPPGEPRGHTGHTWDVLLGVRNHRVDFPLLLNLTTQIAVARRTDNVLRTLGDLIGECELEGTYDLELTFRNIKGQQVGRPHRIRNYIVEGNPNIEPSQEKG